MAFSGSELYREEHGLFLWFPPACPFPSSPIGPLVSHLWPLSLSLPDLPFTPVIAATVRGIVPRYAYLEAMSEPGVSPLGQR